MAKQTRAITGVIRSKQEIDSIKKAMVDIFYFATFVYIIHPIRGKVQFNLYPFQKAVLWQFLTNRFNIVLKFRQAGITELIALYCLWRALFMENQNIQIISIKDKVAKKVLRRIKYMYKHLPDYMKVKVVNGTGSKLGTTEELEFANGSTITSIPTTEDAGRSEAVSLLVIDEAAILRWASTIWAAAFPTLSCVGYKTPIFLKNKKEVKKGSFKTEVKVVEIGSICPDKPGVKDISNLGFKTLSHRGLWQNVLFTQNKGKLETWEVSDCKDKIIKATPDHRFYTIKGWKTLREIIDKKLHIVQAETGLDKLNTPPIINTPKEEVIKPIKDFPSNYISNLGRVYKKKGNELMEVLSRPNKDGYLRVGLTNGVKRGTGDEFNLRKNKTFQLPIARLVYQAFIGPIPKGYQIDHINCNRKDNYITNLRILTPSENVGRSSKYSLMALLNPITGDKLPDLDKRSRILYLSKKGYSYKEIADKVYPDALQGSKFVKRILTERGSRVYISRLKLINVTREDIYDIHVENDNSYISADNYINHNTGGSAIVNSCVTGDTEIMTKKGPLRIDKIAPKKFGTHNLDYLGLHALTHKGQYKRILGAVNKGDLETWEIENNRGMVLRCTPNHKLLTINGWRSVKQIIEKGLKPIFYELYTQESPPVTRKVYTSKIKVNRKYIDTIYDISVEDDQSYITLSQYVNHNTPFGIGNWFHQMWVEACSSGGASADDFNPIRLFWDMHPERGIDWYNSMKNILGPRRTAQEIDGDFLTSGNSVFDLMDIKAIEDDLSEHIPIKLGFNGNLRIYKAPEKGKRYFVGADIASGRARDYSAFTIMDRDGEEMACFKGKITIERFAKLLYDISYTYNIALLAPEANDIGQGVIKLLQEWNYSNLYYSIQLIKEKGDKRAKKAKIPGWLTSSKNRHTIIMELESDVRNDNVEIKDPFFVQEAYTFIYNEMNRPVAMGKDKVKGDQGDEMFDQVYSDDAILAKSITNFVRKGHINSVVVAPK